MEIGAMWWGSTSDVCLDLLQNTILNELKLKKGCEL